MIDHNEGLMLADGLDGAFIGLVGRFGSESVACYDYDKVIAQYVERDGMTEEEARKFFDDRVIGDWAGERTPCYLVRMTLEDARDGAVA